MALVLSRTSEGSDPVTVEEARDFARISSTTDDAIVEGLITAARAYAEDVAGRSLVTSTWVLYLDGFPTGDIILPRPPSVSVTHIKYDDEDGNNQTWLNTLYQTDFQSEPGRVAYIEGGSYPATQASTFNTVVVTYTAGYTTVPESYKLGIKMLVNHWYETRRPVTDLRAMLVVPFNIVSLLRRDRVRSY